MKKFILSLGILATAAGVLLAKTEKEQVLMTVNGRPVYKSEFEYLYNKNAGQQVEPQTLDEYVDMFVNYKLKVADALANKYDTTASYRSELAQYRTELASPYMTDPEAEQELLDEAYQRYSNLIKVSHIMFQRNPAVSEATDMAFADSVRNEILAGRLDWNDAVKEYSIDRGSNENGGLMGWISAGRFPAAFEDMAYATPVGEISAPVNSGYGIHLIRVEEAKSNPGEVKARHILKLTARKSPEDAAKAKEQIDSIYTVLMNGADFAEVARTESEDPGSRANGGELDWFGSGMMVAPFDSAAFSMAEGVISRPIETAYGWHIIEVTGHHPMKDRAEMETNLKQMLMNSEKGVIPQQRYMEKILKRYDSHIIPENLDIIQETIAANAGGYDSTMIAQLSTMTMPVAVVNGEQIPVSDVMTKVAVTASTDPVNGRALIESAAKQVMNAKTRERAMVDMVDTNPDYRNLVNEYSDGILLFDISQDKVWQKAANDREGLQKYFNEHRSDYTFDEPRYKAVIVFTTSDSLENAVKDYLATIPEDQINPLTIGKELRDKFGKHVRAERVIAKKGENPITDYLGFGAARPDNKTISWSHYFAIKDAIIDAPVEADDVRSKVTTDYQSALENEWVAQLRKKYPVKIDKKVLKTVKPLAPAAK